MSLTREQFKLLAAGKCVYGKGAVDQKHLELYVEGAIMAWDLLMNNGKSQPIARGNEPALDESSQTKLSTN